MITDSGPILAVLVLTGWCTAEEATKMQANLIMKEIPTNVGDCISQLEHAREVARGH